jgi:lysophospholipase L1-like esterase
MHHFVIKKTYRQIAIISLNSIILVLVCNLLLSVYYNTLWMLDGEDSSQKSNTTNPIEKKYGGFEDKFKEIYPGYSLKEVRALLGETWSRKNYMYEVFTQFRESPFEGRYVNISEHGYRFSRNQGPWPPSPKHYNIFIFGGSTTFGYGVADGETIPSYLQDKLSEKHKKIISVYNFGRGNYYSSQELILFQRLILGGLRPDVAVFLDGINDMYYKNDEPKYTAILKKTFSPDRLKNRLNRESNFCYGSGRSIAICHLFRSLNKKPAKIVEEVETEIVIDNSEMTIEESAALDSTIQTYQNNKTMIQSISDQYNIATIFAWQPSPEYKNPLKYYYFGKNMHSGVHRYSRFGYQKVAALYKQGKMGRNFVWCADIQENQTKPLYVDMYHYTSVLSEEIANCIMSGFE